MREPAIAPATEEPGTFGGDMGQRSGRVTLRKIADEVAANVLTVSRIINFSDEEICRRSSGEMIERIRVVVAARGYQRNPHAARSTRESMRKRPISGSSTFVTNPLDEPAKPGLRHRPHGLPTR